MKKTILISTAAALTLSCFTGCETNTQTGALAGAAIGYGIRGDARGAAIGAGIGAVTGAIADAAVGQPYYGTAPRGYTILVAEPVRGHRGFVYSPYRDNVIVDVRGVPRGSHVRCPHSGRVFFYR